jgi:SAM-dependent methyltransferase
MSAAPALQSANPAGQFSLRCPSCDIDIGTVVLSDPPARARCHRCGFDIRNLAGIWRALSPRRQLYFRQFVSEYEHIRQAEGRGSDSPEYYLALPFRDLSGRNEWQWNIRARSYRCLQRKLLPFLEKRSGGPLRVLDLGAGNGWLSYRLALRGHDCVAVDLLDNDSDGLGAVRHYTPAVRWPIAAVQAELDRLPFSAGQFDLAIFNASFHYSENYARTLAEALRCVRAGGCVAIMDSPWYERDASGQDMVQEKHASFERQHGTRSDSIASLEYLTPERLEVVEQACGIEWKFVEPWYGVKWALRPWKAFLRGRRTPSRFRLYWATVERS